MSRWSPATVNLWFCVLLYLFSFFSFSEKAASALEGLSFYQDVCSGHRSDKVVHSVSGCENTWKYLIFSDFVEEMVGVLYCLFKRLEFTYSMFFFLWDNAPVSQCQDIHEKDRWQKSKPAAMAGVNEKLFLPKRGDPLCPQLLGHSITPFLVPNYCIKFSDIRS